MKRSFNQSVAFPTALIIASLGGVAGTAFAQNPPASVDDRLKRMEQRQDELERQLKSKDARIAELEAQTNRSPARTIDGTNYVTVGGFLMKVGVPEPPREAFPQGTSAIRDYKMFGEYQEAAPRVDNIPIDPSGEGFMPLFGTRTAVKLGGYARVDSIVDFENNGNPNQFIPATIPVDGEPGAGGGERFQLHSKATRLSLELRRAVPGNNKNLRIYYENDFFNNSSASSMDYRLRHFYGQAYNFLVGQTFTTFMDIDSWPDTVDFQGPNALINRRQPQVRYTIPLKERQMSLAFAIEQPSVDLAGDGIPEDASTVNHAPDGVVAWRFENKRGHLQASGIVRMLGYELDGADGNTELGWGGSLAGALNVGEDKLTGGVAYGEGIGRYINDTSGLGLDAALDGGGDLRALPVFAAYGGYSHQWTKQWRSTASYGYVWADAEESLGPLAYQYTQYASLNLLWQPTKALRMGLEYLYGQRKAEGGAAGEGHRVNLVLKYDLVR
jgi:hypothetical protein